MNVLSKWSKGLRFRLVIISLIPTIALGTVAFFGINTALKLQAKLYQAAEVRARLIEFTGNMEAAGHATARMAWTALALDNETERLAAIKKTKFYIEEFNTAKDNYTKLPRSPNMVELFKKVEENWPEATKQFHALLEMIEKNQADYKTAGLNLMVTKIRAANNAVIERLNEMQQARRETMEKDLAETNADTHFSIIFLISLSIISGIVSLALGIMIAIKTTAALTKVTNILNSSSEQVSSASAQVASSAQELSQASTEQAASLQETSTALEQMTSMVSKNTENSKTAAKTSIRSQEKTNQGKEAVGRMIDSMGEINRSNANIALQIEASNLQMTEIAKVIQVIGSKTKVINDIVFQTKLLSFNASVEAARAGEQGKGFSVVAEEVGNLAQMSGNAAREISAMLDESIIKVDAIVAETKSKVEALMFEGKKKVSIGMDVANECNDLLNEIVDDVTSLSAASNEISSASQEQSVGITEINKAVGQLDQTNQQNSAVSEQTASAAEDLSTQATALQNAVLQLSNVVEGDFRKSA